MADSRFALLKILARIRPEIWELLGGGPQGEIFGPVPDPWHRVVGQAPIPQPWRADPVDVWRTQSQYAAVQLARRFVDAASLTHAQGGDGPGLLRKITDDWGIEGRPPHVPLPRDWWHSIPPPPPPRPNEIDVIAILGAAGLSFASLSEQLEDAGLRGAVADAGQRVLDLATERFARL